MVENTYKNILVSSSATVVAEFLTLPICTIKTNFQNISDMKFQPRIWDVTKSIYNRGGISPFYAASFPAIFGQIFSTTSKYTLYRYFESNNEYPVKNKFLNGMTAGIISSIFTHPMDVIKVHLQMGKRIGMNDINIFYKGYSKTFLKIGISSSLFFPLYEIIQKKIENPFLSAGSSGIVACFLMHPVDYLKTRHMAGLKLYDGWDPRVYYRGLSINLLRIVPHFVVTMVVIEKLKEII